MRVLTWVVVIAALAWGGVWVVASRTLQAQAEAWLATPGNTVQADAVRVQGFPNRLDLVLTAPRLADPASGIAWAAPFAEVATLVYKPWHLIASLPPGQRIDTPGGGAILDSTRLQASLRLTPSTALPLAHLGLTGDALRLTLDSGEAIALDSLRIAMAQLEGQPATYSLALEALRLAPDPGFLEALPARSPLPPEAEALRLRVTLGFTAPLDRFAAEAMPGLTAITLDEASLTWGPIRATASGTLTADADGFASGRLALSLEGWQAALDAAATAGLMTPEDLATASDLASRAATAAGTPDRIDLPLTFTGGRISFGLIPIGPAPRLLR